MQYSVVTADQGYSTEMVKALETFHTVLCSFNEAFFFVLLNSVIVCQMTRKQQITRSCLKSESRKYFSCVRSAVPKSREIQSIYPSLHDELHLTRFCKIQQHLMRLN